MQCSEPKPKELCNALIIVLAFICACLYFIYIRQCVVKAVQCKMPEIEAWGTFSVECNRPEKQLAFKESKFPAKVG